ncbi:hypothetical protein EAI_10033 [Harpegnathos saltator]|uniref:C2H2-type domain-containing protein n=1 Tax=Harpegnathos saltator TaxID=610380 RepID=E2BJ95_HARSA|nr:hypothetical protein EAI_10033 [Harpegnathos saltator]
MSLSVAALLFNNSNNIGEHRFPVRNTLYLSPNDLKRHPTSCFMDLSSSSKSRCKTKQRSKNIDPKCLDLRITCDREPKFECPYCGLKSLYTGSIYRHIRRKHKGEDLFMIIGQNKR